MSSNPKMIDDVKQYARFSVADVGNGLQTPALSAGACRGVWGMLQGESTCLRPSYLLRCQSRSKHAARTLATRRQSTLLRDAASACRHTEDKDLPSMTFFTTRGGVDPMRVTGARSNQIAIAPTNCEQSQKKQALQARAVGQDGGRTSRSVGHESIPQ